MNKHQVNLLFLCFGILTSGVTLAHDCVVSDGVIQEGTTITGTPDHDIIRCNEAVEGHNISAGAGHDRVQGSAYDDVISGGPGRDVLIGMGGADTLLGQSGRDELYDGDGSVPDASMDFLNGGIGPGDLCQGGNGDIMINCE